MNLKKLIITGMFAAIAGLCLGQSTEEADKGQVSNDVEKIFMIQVDISQDASKFFPKLYPIGYIVKRTDNRKKLTKYLLGEFTSQEAADQALKEVKASGYSEAFVLPPSTTKYLQSSN